MSPIPLLAGAIAVLWLTAAPAPALAQSAAGSSATTAAPASPSTGVAQPTLNDPVLAKREYELSLQLRCLVCQNQSVAESRAGIAVDLRNQVREQVAAGKSDREIIDFMTIRYGDFVLYKPPVKGTTLLLWFGPLLLLVTGALVAWRILRARRSAPARPALTDAERARAAALLGGEGSAK
jgi:cytochrome c-type biogenesis protein CcmH